MMTSPKQGPAADGRARCLSSLELLGDRRELLISHNGEIYRLRITANGKLILTK